MRSGPPAADPLRDQAEDATAEPGNMEGGSLDLKVVLMDAVEAADAASGADDHATADAQDAQPGWLRERRGLSLPEAHASLKVPGAGASPWRMMLAFVGCGAMVSVGYMDPGNWSTGLAGGARYGYSLLCVVLLSSAAAMFLQHLALKLGVAAGRDLAQACRDAYPRWACVPLWIMAEVAIIACDLAEVIGSAVALQLLFGLPLWAGVLVTAADVLLVMLVEGRSFRWLELGIFALILGIFGCFVYEIVLARPVWRDVAVGLLPTRQVFTDPSMLTIAVGILGATVMPHNLYLHSAVIQTRAYERTPCGRRRAILYGTLDSTLALCFAFLVNAAILILAAAAFYYSDHPHREEVDITDAYNLLAPSLGAKAASIVFAVALLASGQNSTITGTLAGQVVLEGFLQLEMRPWLRRLLTRGAAIVPAAAVAAALGDAAVGRLLIISQVVLSLQLSFAVFPLVHFTTSARFVGRHAAGRVAGAAAWALAVAIAGLNIYLLVQFGINGGM
ncbi:MAG: natural resistance associated macrophage protein [Monoraphidium minutum]|nr:MAG: natural resistance associated macrophage protein [Monoraphidium minutum]